jgi:hypothetical protein
MIFAILAGTLAGGHFRAGTGAGTFSRRGPQGSAGPGVSREHAMKALALYVLFVVIGAAISVAIGLYIEKQFSTTASLVVFLALFFANFGTSWIAVIFVMDGNLKDAQGRAEQIQLERAGKRS